MLKKIPTLTLGVGCSTLTCEIKRAKGLGKATTSAELNDPLGDDPNSSEYVGAYEFANKYGIKPSSAEYDRIMNNAAPSLASLFGLHYKNGVLGYYADDGEGIWKGKMKKWSFTNRSLKEYVKAAVFVEVNSKVGILSRLLHYFDNEFLIFGDGENLDPIVGNNKHQSGNKVYTLESDEILTVFNAIAKDFYRYFKNLSNSANRGNPDNNTPVVQAAEGANSAFNSFKKLLSLKNFDEYIKGDTSFRAYGNYKIPSNDTLYSPSHIPILPKRVK